MPVDHLAHLEADADALAAVLRTTEPDASVPGCPGWALRDLAGHLGGVHRWATWVVRADGSPQQAVEVPADEQLADWFTAGARDLLAALRAAGPDGACWTFGGPGQAAFWARRQAHETAVHRVDAQRAAGLDHPLDPELADDGIAEVLEVMLPRQIALGRIPEPTTGVTLVTGESRLLGAAPATATVTGPPEAVLLLLWRRLPRTDPRLEVSGDVDALDALLAVAITP